MRAGSDENVAIDAAKGLYLNASMTRQARIDFREKEKVLKG